jgi:hypothetical protein
MPMDYLIDHDRRFVQARGRGILTDADVFGFPANKCQNRFPRIVERSGSPCEISSSDQFQSFQRAAGLPRLGPFRDCPSTRRPSVGVVSGADDVEKAGPIAVGFRLGNDAA